jgi:acetyltransferase-like isoleucine patch superfamily enzyme
MPVHLFGQAAKMEAFEEIAKAKGLTLLEDHAQSQGAKRNGKRCGTFGKGAATSFFPGKNLGAYGDGGAVVTSDDSLAERVRHLRNYGSEKKYFHPEIGFNSRLDTLQAVVLSAKLKRLDGWNANRREAASRYDEMLEGVSAVSVMPVLDGNEPVYHLYVIKVPRLDGNEPVYHLYVIKVPRRDDVLAGLHERGVGAGIHYPTPLHQHGALADLGYDKGAFPIAERLAGEILTRRDPDAAAVPADHRGSAVVRRGVAESGARLMSLDESVFVHERALVESDDIGPRTRVWAFAHVLGGAKVGADCNLCDGSFVEGGAVVGDRCTLKNHVSVWEGVTLEDDVFLGPNAVLTNDMNPRNPNKRGKDEWLVRTLIRRGSSIGANATIVCGITVGERAFVGAGSVVIKDVPAYGLMVGNPARRVGWMCECGERVDDETLSCGCGRRYRLVSDQAGLALASQDG